ncbi:hypothetical protein BCR44DRAFT_223997 [Catenaria anguillulae PL171]|uniref:Uncharacterized protein n=1 Tax=Catenaria anguillulae PL171 TaxID=765915 RepID=A0A1Y2HYZ8_9FUNG|nr:hypothetical protein BCR44DRAFT_223997 [Catenaria anguillulae PL171]
MYPCPMSRYLSVAQPKFFAYLDEHPLFKEWFFDMLYRAPISCSRRPWPINVLRFSLVLSSTSSMACRLLRSIGFTLPGKSTIRKNPKKFAVEPGVNLDRIKRMVAELQWHLPELRAKYKDETEEQRHDLLHTVVLVADEVQDVPEVVVDRTTLKVTGLINHGPGVYTGERENQEVPAKHTLQLMCVSLGASKAIPVAHFDSRDMNTPEFVSMVSKAVVALNLAGLKVIAIGADGGSVNRAGFKVLGEPDNWPDGIPCPLLFQDIPHLLKRFRNVLLNHGILKKGDNVMSWFSIEALYEKSEKHPGLRLIQRLIKDALHPDAWSKMRVPLARAVMCEKTAYGVENYSEHPDGAATAEFIRQVDTLYTIMTDTVPFTKDSLIKGGKDDRLDRLQAVLKYFEDWKVDMEDKVAKIRAGNWLRNSSTDSRSCVFTPARFQPTASRATLPLSALLATAAPR